jgi:hypothetical protein
MRAREYGVSDANLKEIDHFKNLDAEVRRILRLILKK